MANEHIFQNGNDWFFWDETGTQFIGPYEDEYKAIDGRVDYERYLTDGIYSENLQEKGWQDAEAEIFSDCYDFTTRETGK